MSPVVSGFTGCLISTAEASLIKKYPEKAQEAETYTNRARALLDAKQIKNIKAVGHLDISLVKFLPNKFKGNEQVSIDTLLLLV